MLTIDLFEELEGPPEPTLIDALRDFLPLAIKHLELKELPKIKLLGDVETDHMPSFGKFSNDDSTIHLGIKNRHPNDILRTLAHELTHYTQGINDQLDADSGATGSPEEDQANAEAGVIMREFNQQFPQYMELKPIMLEKWSKKYKKSINCSNPKGFSQKAHCAGRKKNTNEAEDNLEENLRDWFKKDKWVRMDTKGNIKGDCAREPGEGKPKCLPQAKAHALGKKGRAAAAQKKRREDPDPDRRGPAKNVATKVREESTRRDPKDLTAPTDQELDKLHHKFIPAWSMLDHDLLATAYDFQDDDTALSYVNQLDDVEQSMDHNAVITMDNARVSIKVRTGDIDGLSRLDFEFALRANDLAKQLQADQLPHATNAINEQQFDENCWKGYHKEGNKKMFGKTVPNCVKNESITEQLCPECGGSMYPESMINEKQDACYHKVKSRYKVWPSAYASGALVQCRKKGAANWGNKSKNESAELGKHCSVKNAVPELKAALTKRKSELKTASAKVAYDKIDKIMTRIAQTYKISGQELHDLWTERYGEIPDTWVLGESTKAPNKVLTINGLTVKFFDNVIAFYKDHNLLWGKEGDYSNPSNNSIHTAKQIASWLTQKMADKKLLSRTDKTLDENFADGKGPGRPGDSQRHGIPKGATMAQLEKAAKAPGRKGQLARWQINMRRGKKK